MAHFYGSTFSIEANKENIPPGMERLIKNEQLVLPEPRQHRHQNDDNENGTSPRPSPAMSQLSDASFVSCHDSPIVNNSADEGDEDGEITSRKEKSLGLLCQRFLIAMNEETRNSQNKEVHLETVAKKMNVEKRRIYDIVNVMEALDAMQKTNKSFYQWQGLEDLPKLMCDLQAEAVSEGLPDRVLRVEQAMCSFTELASPSGGKKEIVGSLVGPTPSTSTVVPKLENDRKSRVDNRDRQGRNSLAQLCRRFLMVLLSNPKNVRKVSLDVASTVLIKDPDTEGFEPPSRSRCRRLYDIANVLVALGLIKKVHYLFGTKKIPLFVYCGPEPDYNATFDVYESVERLLSSQATTPLTPTIKATTERIVQQIAGFGKRSASETHLDEKNANKIAKVSDGIQSNCNLMMFADLDKFRLDALAHHFSIMPPYLPSTSSQPIFSTFPPSAPIPSPNRLSENFVMPLMENKSLPLKPTLPVPKPTRVPFGERTNTLAKNNTPPMKHSMSNILGNSNRQNVPQFEHTETSAFQVVKKEAVREK
ncbi:unnamed protein product [Caenorhabditis bovis]|uniref:E2F/DP family winged-helix DNA-binding domain-containing protein n=1 Tax=Caenorhabditis bovis TaxID=2654633 RepID=A0A8S1FC09_9PELO|nr:unnamed protein product [Caenorhabditis bovis]